MPVPHVKKAPVMQCHCRLAAALMLHHQDEASTSAKAPSHGSRFQHVGVRCCRWHAQAAHVIINQHRHCLAISSSNVARLGSLSHQACCLCRQAHAILCCHSQIMLPSRGAHDLNMALYQMLGPRSAAGRAMPIRLQKPEAAHRCDVMLILVADKADDTRLPSRLSKQYSPYRIPRALAKLSGPRGWP